MHLTHPFKFFFTIIAERVKKSVQSIFSTMCIVEFLQIYHLSFIYRFISPPPQLLEDPESVYCSFSRRQR